MGGQIISADISKAHLPETIHLGLGYYVTTKVGGDGEIGYAHQRIVRLNSP